MAAATLITVAKTRLFRRTLRNVRRTQEKARRRQALEPQSVDPASGGFAPLLICLVSRLTRGLDCPRVCANPETKSGRNPLLGHPAADGCAGRGLYPLSHECPQEWDKWQGQLPPRAENHCCPTCSAGSSPVRDQPLSDSFASSHIFFTNRELDGGSEGVSTSHGGLMLLRVSLAAQHGHLTICIRAPRCETPITIRARGLRAVSGRRHLGHPHHLDLRVLNSAGVSPSTSTIIAGIVVDKTPRL
jgi:hypothetical protein